jgi:hypothetical protein
LDGLRITQAGSGNALVVEDASLDSSPFVITGAGNVGIGTSSPTEKLNVKDSASGGSAVVRIINSGSPVTNNKCLISFDTSDVGLGVRDAQIYAINGGTNNVSLVFATANGSPPAEAMRISPAGNVGIGTSSPSAKLSIDGGNVSLNNATYATYQTVSGTVEGQFAANSSGAGVVDVRAVSNHPMLFYTNNTEKMRITAAGDVGIGATPIGSNRLYIGGTFPSASSQTQVVRVSGTFPSATTGTASSFLSRPVTAAASYTLSDLIHFHANPDTFGAGSTVTSQFGFYADNTLTGATNNYGFYSAIASGSGRYNFYAAGTADNYFGGNVGIGVAPLYRLHVQGGYTSIGAFNTTTLATSNSNGGAAFSWNRSGGSAETNIVNLFDNAGLSFEFAQKTGASTASVLYQLGTDSHIWRISNNEAMRINSAGDVGIGASSPGGRLEVREDASGSVPATMILSNPALNSAGTGADLRFYVNDGTSARYAAVRSVQVTSGNVADLRFLTANFDLPAVRMTITPAGDVGIGTGSPTALLTVNGVGAFGAGTDAAPSITKFDDLDTGVWFPSGNNIAVSTAGVERLRVNASGNLYITSPAAFGYSTGAGSSVTQATSRTTGVTLNFPTGRITLFSAAGTTAWQSFTVTNSTVDASDNVIVNQRSGTDLYQIFVTNVTAGSFRITFATTGGTTTEAPTFSFSVVKGAIT